MSRFPAAVRGWLTGLASETAGVNFRSGSGAQACARLLPRVSAVAWRGLQAAAPSHLAQENEHAEQEHNLPLYDGNALDAARFYAEVFPDSAVGAVTRAPGDFPDGKQGEPGRSSRAPSRLRSPTPIARRPSVRSKR